MKNSQSGFALIILIIGVAFIAVMAAAYFTKTSGKDQKTQYENGQEAIKQAEQINAQSLIDAQTIQNELK